MDLAALLLRRGFLQAHSPVGLNSVGAAARRKSPPHFTSSALTIIFSKFTRAEIKQDL
jgi:hypothetical protein